MKDYSISHISKDAPFTETLENTDENLNMLINKGYKQSPNSKRSSLDSVLRYNPKRMVYWYSSKKSAYDSDCFFSQQSIKTIYRY